ncbi:cation-transporting P-type ATPase [Nodosilinea sp. LEGE 07088]|uniref:cation-translocating P-type ATPase n=1 Tax=Nodosilinea sp. LEGE 07088 TaxID=2777968 RepID=UPI00188217E6|nr:cation-transporting P-type ATPase [Nodosilinea sp. LEGE 07088]MBE9137480.1 cation-transporting P-type ATPase [Nodosilinea sp. LEGE 07088]
MAFGLRSRQDIPPAQGGLKSWHSLPLVRVLSLVDVDPEVGLTAEVVRDRLSYYGPNTLPAANRRSALGLWVEQFISWPVGLLAMAALLSEMTGSPVDAAVILGVVVINAIIGFTTESQSERIIRSLQQTVSPKAQVRRDGRAITVDSAEIVPGDVLLLQAGQAVVADARVIDGNRLSLDESSLTGESLSVAKQPADLEEDAPLPERHNLVFKGTLVTGGAGLAVVVTTGTNTELGAIQALVDTTQSQDTPLQRQLSRVSGQLVVLCSVVCAVIFTVGAWRGYDLLHALKISISLAVAAVPEGLPAVATTTLALGIQTMRQRKILIRALPAVETLGTVQAICLDKTGTITANRMAVQAVALAAGDVSAVEPLWGSPALDRLLTVAVLCNESQLMLAEDKTSTLQGSGTENALLTLAIAAGIAVAPLRQRYPRLALNLRQEDRLFMSTLHRTPEGGGLVAVKGSPNEVLDRCSHWLLGDRPTPLTASDRQHLKTRNQAMAEQALRVLAIAERAIPLESGQPPLAPAAYEQNLTWLGLVGLADPIREGVPELITAFHRAGIDTVMVTGDQRATAKAIGEQVKLGRQGELTIVDAYDLADMFEGDSQSLTHRIDIFARISPADKLQVVRTLQAANKVVAMVGDGINDTPALKAANVGLAMGSSKTEGVHDVADVIIQDDNLGTVIDAIAQGRTTYTNIRKVVHYLLATNLSEIMVVAVATLVGLGDPLNAIQLLWLNLVTDIFPGLGLALDPADPTVLEQPPRAVDTPIINPTDLRRMVWEASVISLIALAAYGYGLGQYGAGATASTIAFMGLTLAQVLHALVCRTEIRRGQDNSPLPANPYLIVAVVGSLVLQLLPLAVPALGELLHIAPLAPRDYGVIVATALIPLAINAVSKPTAQSESLDSTDIIHP